MKTTAFGITGLAIVIFTILAVLQICAGHTRTTNLQDNLQQALESSLETALDGDKTYTINSDEELIADVLEGIAMRLDDNCQLEVEVNAIDRTKGLLSVKATAYYMTSHPDVNGDGVIDEQDEFQDLNGDGVLDGHDWVSSVTAERTVILEEYDVATVGKYTILYQMVDDDGVFAMYKKYTLSAGSPVMAPKDPTVNFDGHWYLNGETPMTADEIEDLTLDQDYVFTNRPVELP